MTTNVGVSVLTCRRSAVPALLLMLHSVKSQSPHTCSVASKSIGASATKLSLEKPPLEESKARHLPQNMHLSRSAPIKVWEQLAATTMASRS